MGTKISDRKIKITVDFFKNVLSLPQSKESKIIAVATQAAREAPNFSDLQREISEKFSVDLCTISGEQEAKLSATTVRKVTGLDEFVSFDLGCGSIEIVEFKKEICGIWSVPVSSLRLSQSHDIKSAEAAIGEEFGAIKFRSGDVAKYPLIGSGGTLRLAVSLVSGPDGSVAHYHELQTLLHRVAAMTKDEMVAFGIPMARADIFPYGLLIILQLMRKIGAGRVVAARGNLRVSLAFDFFNTLDDGRKP
jgi:exopolyphosphatase/guanosine-5'-triphosphate,3'-diphosphate pyrophosphatase